MKLFTRWFMSAGLIVAAGAANAQAPVPGYGPRLLPPQEVYTVLRDHRLSPLGIPVRRGYVYTISVIDRGGHDGRLMIDARNGRILRFLPASRMGDNFDSASTSSYGRPDLSPGTEPQRAVPKVASRTAVPIPRPAPRATEAQPLAAQPATEPAPQSAEAATKPAEPRTVGQTAAAPAATTPAAPIEAKPAPQILPTQDMPEAQGLE